MTKGGAFPAPPFLFARHARLYTVTPDLIGGPVMPGTLFVMPGQAGHDGQTGISLILFGILQFVH